MDTKLTFVTVRLDNRVEGFRCLGNIFACLHSQLLHEAIVLECNAQLGLAFAFQTLHNILVVQADLMGKTTDLAVFAIRVKGENAHGNWYADTTD